MKFKVALLAVLVLGIAFSTAVFARSSGYEVTLVNRTGRDIEVIYISPVARSQWEPYYGDTLYSGDDMDIYVSSSDVQFWDIRCEYTNGREDTWYGVDLYNARAVILRRDGDFDISGSRHNSRHNSRHGHDSWDDDYNEPRY